MEILKLVPRWLLALAVIGLVVSIILSAGSRPIENELRTGSAIGDMRMESTVSSAGEVARIVTGILWLAVLGTVLIRRGKEA